ncbi:MAG: hypothetical protein ABIV47_11315 [Roseiflexaceae bacterium]
MPVAVISDLAEALACVDATYAAFRHAPGVLEEAFAVQLLQREDAFLVADSYGYQRRWPDAHTALLDLLDRMVHGVLARLHKLGMYAIHAGAVVYNGAALMIAGRSGQGKTTLVLGLLRRGLGLLSDEFAIADAAQQLIQPYRRSLHIRPGTPDLISELAFLRDQPQQRLGGGIEWTLTPDQLARALPGGLASAAPPCYVLLLDGPPRPQAAPVLVPVPAAVATLELLRGTWAASIDFGAGLARIGRLLDGVACARLRAGALEPTLDMLLQWLEDQRG